MKVTKSFWVLIFVLQIAISKSVFAQQPEQDCIAAIPVCQNTYVQNNSYVGHGTIQELNYPANSSCLSANEVNSVWYIFTVSGAGNLNLTITPNNINDDYDWAIYDITGVGCTGILNGTAPNVRCNYSAFPGNTGMQTGALPTSVPPAGLPWCAPLPVLVGETYVLLINNAAATPNGYTLNFSGTAQIFDNVPPTAVSVSKTVCNPVDTLVLTVSEQIKCSSMAANGSDFTVTGPSGVVVSGASSLNCVAGLFTNTINILLAAPINVSGTYTLHFQNGSDGNTLLDNCNNALDPAQTLTFNVAVLNPQFNIVHALGCVNDVFTVTDQSSGSQFNNWNWNFGPGIFNSALQNDVFNYGVNGNYTITLTVTDTGGCTATTSQNVSVNIFAPVSSFTYSPLVICANDPVQFTSTALNATTFHWDFGDGNTSTLQNPSHVFATTGNYNVQFIAGNNIPCYDTSTQNIQLQVGVVANFDFLPAHACLGDVINFADLTPGNPNQWHWDFGGGNISVSQNPFYVFPSVGLYTVTLITSNGICLPDTVSKNVDVNFYPVVNLGSDTSICVGESVPLDAGNPGMHYTWFDGTTSQTNVVTVAPVDAWVMVDNGGCVTIDTLFINSECIIAVPNAFTPNGDGRNDLFLVINKNIGSFHLQIFNRWGQKVFETKDQNEGWDGNYHGVKEETGTYVYSIELTFINGQTVEKKGNVTLIR